MLAYRQVLVPGTMAGEQTIITAMDFLKETFDKYADMDDNKGTMSKKEFTELLRQQLKEVWKNNAQYCCSRELRMLPDLHFLFSLLD